MRTQTLEEIRLENKSKKDKEIRDRRIRNGDLVLLTRKEIRELPEYNCSVPTFHKNWLKPERIWRKSKLHGAQDQTPSRPENFWFMRYIIDPKNSDYVKIINIEVELRISELDEMKDILTKNGIIFSEKLVQEGDKRYTDLEIDPANQTGDKVVGILGNGVCSVLRYDWSGNLYTIGAIQI